MALNDIAQLVEFRKQHSENSDLFSYNVKISPILRASRAQFTHLRARDYDNGALL